MTTTNELHAAIYTTQTLLKQAADVIEHNAKSLAESHTKNGIIEDREVQAMVESDTLLVAHLRAAALPWDQRHKSTERPQSRAHQFPAEQVAAVKAELQVAVEAHGLTAKPEPTGSMGMPISCGKPLCSPGDHHPLCKLAEQPAANLWLYWKVDDKSTVTGPFKTHSKDEAYGLDCIDQMLLTVAAPQPAQQQEPVAFIDMREWPPIRWRDGMVRKDVARFDGQGLFFSPPAQRTDDTKRLDALAENSWDLRCFDMPTGAGDGDIGWRVIEHHMAKPYERTVAEVFRDDPRQAIDAAIEAAAKTKDAP